MDEQSSLLVVMIVAPFWQVRIANFNSSRQRPDTSQLNSSRQSLESSRTDIVQDSLLSIGCRIGCTSCSIISSRLFVPARNVSSLLFPTRLISSRLDASRLVGGSRFCHGVIPPRTADVPISARPGIVPSCPFLRSSFSLCLKSFSVSGRKDSSSDVSAPSSDVRTSRSHHRGNLANRRKGKKGSPERKDKGRILRILEVEKTTRPISSMKGLRLVSTISWPMISTFDKETLRPSLSREYFRSLVAIRRYIRGRVCRSP